MTTQQKILSEAVQLLNEVVRDELHSALGELVTCLTGCSEPEQAALVSMVEDLGGAKSATLVHHYIHTRLEDAIAAQSQSAVRSALCEILNQKGSLSDRGAQFGSTSAIKKAILAYISVDHEASFEIDEANNNGLLLSDTFSFISYIDSSFGAAIAKIIDDIIVFRKDRASLFDYEYITDSRFPRALFVDSETLRNPESLAEGFAYHAGVLFATAWLTMFPDAVLAREGKEETALISLGQEPLAKQAVEAVGAAWLAMWSAKMQVQSRQRESQYNYYNALGDKCAHHFMVVTENILKERGLRPELQRLFLINQTALRSNWAS